MSERRNGTGVWSAGLAGAGLCAGLILGSLAAASPAADFDLREALAAAPPGATIHVPPSVHAGPLVIDRPVTLVAAGRVIIDGGGRDDIVHIDAPDVTLRGFTLCNSGDSLDRESAGLVVSQPRARIEDNTLENVLLGIVLRNADESLVRNNRVVGQAQELGRRGDGIRLWNSHGCRIEGNHVRRVRDVVIWYSRATLLRTNVVTESRYGLHFMYASSSTLEENELTGNSVGVFLMYSHDIELRRNRLTHNRGPSGYGLGLKDMDDVRVVENLIAGNRVGVYVDNSPQRFDGVGEFRQNVLAMNDIGLACLPAVTRNRFSDNAFLENIQQVAVLGGGPMRGNDFTPEGRGNFWSDYAGFDAAGDGIGDLPYRATSLFDSLMDREPALRLFLYSPAQQALELAARAFPIMQPEPRVTDTAPRMRPVSQDWLPRPTGAGWPLSSTGASLLAMAGLILARPLRRPSAGAKPVSEGVLPEAAPGAQRPGAPPAGPPPPPVTVAQAVERATEGSSQAALLELVGLRKCFGRQAAVDDVHLIVAAGKAVALWGDNGAGKTTLIKCILGLHGYQGAIRLAGWDARQAGKSVRRLIGYVSQEPAFFDDLGTLETVRLFARLKGAPVSRAAAMLVRVGLDGQQHKRVGQLSGGMKQRLALAVALLSEPPLLLLDEPTSNLDAAARSAFLELLLDLKQSGQTILFTTHRAEEVAYLADHLVVLEHGCVVRSTDVQPAPRLGTGVIRLRITLPAARHADAIERLAQAGFAAWTLGGDVILDVLDSHKTAVLRLLIRGELPIDDFQIESEATHA